MQFDAVSQNVRQRHLKVYYLDEDDRVIGTDFINEVEEDKKSRWNHYEQILIPPKEAVRMQLHIWTRGNEKTAGKLKLKNLEFLPYEKLILVDQFMLAEQTGTPLFATATPETLDVVKSLMRRQITSQQTLGRFTVNDSPTPLFELQDGDTPMRGNIALNGVTQLYRSTQQQAAVTVVLRPIYYAGLGLLALAFPLSLLLIGLMTGQRFEPFRTRLRERFAARRRFRKK